MHINLLIKLLPLTGIEKTSVKLTIALFHRSTIEGVKGYGEKECPDFSPTASFLEIICDWWDSFNVKVPDVGFIQQDSNRDPINAENMRTKHDNYVKLLDWLNLCKQNCKKNKEKHNGLSDETFLTIKQTMACMISLSKPTTACMISLSKYLLHECNFKYILTGHVQNDALESNEELKPGINTEDNEESTSDHDRLTRGGLSEPSDILFITIKECWCVYSSIFDSADAESLFLSFSHPLLTF